MAIIFDKNERGRRRNHYPSPQCFLHGKNPSQQQSNPGSNGGEQANVFSLGDPLPVPRTITYSGARYTAWTDS